MSASVRMFAGVTCLGLVLAAAAACRADRHSDQQALKPYGGLVGGWRGVGQPQRSSARGAWTESAEWIWRLTAESAALEVKVEKGKYLKSARLRPGTPAGSFVLDAVLADGSSRSFSGKPGDHDQLVLTAAGEPAEGVRRVTITPLHDTRLLILLEAQDAGTGAFHRLAEVGYTRKGVAFAAGESYPLCIVTDGRGSIEVKYQGKSYYVCCSGCKDLFEENPAAIIAEAEARRKDKAKDKESPK